MISTAVRIPATARVHLPAVGRTHILPTPVYAGTVGHVARVNSDYYAVSIRPAAGWVANPAIGVSATVWQDVATGEWVTDAWAPGGASVEIQRSRTAEAAIGAALLDCSERGAAQGRW